MVAAILSKRIAINIAARNVLALMRESLSVTSAADRLR
jgi:hypothetical protein